MVGVPIREVVVHPDGALITRRGTLPVEEGEVRIRALPLLLEPTSVRVALGGAPIGVVAVELDLLDEDRRSPDEEVARWIGLRADLEVLDARIAAEREVRDVLAGLSPAWDPEGELRPTIAGWSAWLAAEPAIAERVAAADGVLRQLAEERKQLAEAVAVLGHRIDGASREGWWRRWQPTRRIRVTTAETGEVPVSLSYRVLGARWTPSYTLDVDEALRSGRFSMRAAILQSTGEDWRGVAVTLTSAPSERRIDVPELAASRLGTRSPPPPPSGYRPLPADLEALFPSDLPVAPPPAPPTRARAQEVTADRLEPAKKKGARLGPAPPQGAALEEEQTLTRAPAPAPPPQPLAVPAPKRAARSMVDTWVESVAAPVAAALALGGSAEESGAAPEETEEPFGADLGDDLLDYGRLRLAGWDAPTGQRGRLRAAPDDQSLADRGAPAEARGLLEARIRGSRSRIDAAQRAVPLPQHTVPGPIGGADVSLAAVGLLDLPDDGRWHTVAVGGWPVELAVSYRCVARLDPRAFRRVRATIPYDRPLLPGPVDVYVGGKLELTSPWSGSPGRGELLLGLGAEDRLRVARNVRYREESAGLLGGRRKLVTSVEVLVASSLPRAVQIEILERVPVPATGQDVAIEIVEAQPAADRWKGDPDGPILEGARRQRLEVGPGAEARATLSWSTTLSGKDELVGGDRRG